MGVQTQSESIEEHYEPIEPAGIIENNYEDVFIIDDNEYQNRFLTNLHITHYLCFIIFIHILVIEVHILLMIQLNTLKIFNTLAIVYSVYHIKQVTHKLHKLFILLNV